MKLSRKIECMRVYGEILASFQSVSRFRFVRPSLTSWHSIKWAHAFLNTHCFSRRSCVKSRSTLSSLLVLVTCVIFVQDRLGEHGFMVQALACSSPGVDAKGGEARKSQNRGEAWRKHPEPPEPPHEPPATPERLSSVADPSKDC